MKYILVAIILIMATESAFAKECGTVSYYVSNNITASGEKMDNKKRTVASRKLKFGTKLKITDMISKKTTIAIVNDRGPTIRNRIIDVSLQVAKDLGFTKKGITKVCYEII